MTLRKGIVFSQRKMRPEKVRRTSGEFNPIMGEKFMAKKGISEALNETREQKEFWGLIKSVSKDGVYKKELRKLFGDIRSGKIKTRTISKKEIMKVAKDIFPDSKRRYIFSGPAATEKSGSKYTQVDPSAKNYSSENTGAGRQSSFTRYKPKKVPAQATSSPAQGVASLTPIAMATFRNKIRNLSKDEDGKRAENGFMHALKFVKKE